MSSFKQTTADAGITGGGSAAGRNSGPRYVERPVRTAWFATTIAGLVGASAMLPWGLATVLSRTPDALKLRDQISIFGLEVAGRIGLLLLAGIIVGRHFLPRQHPLRTMAACAAIGAVCLAALLVHIPAGEAGVLWVPAIAILMWGAGMGCSLQKGWWRASGYALISGLGMAGMAAAACLAITDVAPSVIELPSAGVEDRARWKSLLERRDDDAPVELALSEHDLNLLAASWLAARESSMRIRLAVGDQHVSSSVSVPIPAPWPGERFLNAEIRLGPHVADGHINPGVRSIEIGGWSLPGGGLSLLSRLATQLANANVDVQRAVAPIRELHVVGDVVRVVADPQESAKAVAGALNQKSDRFDSRLREAVRIHMEHLAATAGDLPPGDERFLGLLQAALTFARARSATGSPQLENSAALVALGIQIGDPRVRHLAGFDADEPVPHFPYPFARKTTLRGRNDLARHYLVSASLAVLTGREVSDTAGLVKEQLDAGEGGTGFSFADLAADLAGARFGQLATSHESGAKRVQELLRDLPTVDNVMPPVGDLAENLSESEFQARYGSLEDPRFVAASTEIKRRLPECRLLREE